MSATDIAKSVDVDLDLVQEQAASVAEELIAAAKMKEGQILVVGCSSSEIAAHAIGCYSSKEMGEAVSTPSIRQRESTAFIWLPSAAST